MPSFAIPGSRNFATLTGLFAVVVFVGSLGAQSQNDNTPPGTKDRAPFQLRVASNLVVVRVVVRDAQGKPVEGLQREDFKLFDRGKGQSIAQFEAEVSIPEVPLPAPAATPRGPATGPAQARPAPQRFLGLYFDDLDMSDADVIDARDAADHYLATNLQPSEQVAVFTSSAVLSDFTVDLKQIHDALFRLHSHPRISGHAECPELTDYEALEITQHEPNNSDAWKMAADEAINHCHMPSTADFNPDSRPGSVSSTDSIPAISKQPTEDTITYIRTLARTIVDESQMQARTSLQGLEQVVNIVTRAPGQRSIILVSPGFLSQSEQYQLDRIIDRALRSAVVISSLDPRGLALLMRESDLTSGYTPSAGSGAIGAQHTVDTTREMVATNVLSEIAEGTGGEFFHDNNDLSAGFRALAGSQGAYVLAFAPTDTKQDGKFHALKVTLTEKHQGFTLQARRGYFAPREGAVAEAPPAEAQPQVGASSDADAQVQEQVREAALSKTDVQELPVEVHTKVSPGAASTRELSVLAHLDARSLHFRKEGERNQGTVTFVSVIFDRSGKYVTGQQRQAKVDMPDDALPSLLAKGIDIEITFQLKPGTYIVREVVADAEERHMTAFSHNVTIP